MQFEQFIHRPVDDQAEGEHSRLQRELETARKTIRDLQRQAHKAQAQYAEIRRAYDMTIANLVKATSRCSVLEEERMRWHRHREERVATVSLSTGPLVLSAVESAAIRKAMARLHHPDAGGNVERMKAWNALLDRLEELH